MVDMILAREALAEIMRLGRSMREAASFLSEQCFEQNVHAWAFLNDDQLRPVPHEIWPALMWSALPDEHGKIHSDGGRLSIRGDWPSGRISYREDSSVPMARRFNMQGIRFDRLEFDGIKPAAATWASEIIGALPLRALPSIGKGRPPGTGGHAAADDPLVEKMHELIRNTVGMTPNAAAAQFAPDAAGSATFERKQKRLAQRYRDKYL